MKNLKWVVVALVVGFMLFGMGAFAQKQLTIGISTDAGYPARAIEVIGIYESAPADQVPGQCLCLNLKN